MKFQGGGSNTKCDLFMQSHISFLEQILGTYLSFSYSLARSRHRDSPTAYPAFLHSYYPTLRFSVPAMPQLV